MADDVLSEAMSGGSNGSVRPRACVLTIYGPYAREESGWFSVSTSPAHPPLDQRTDLRSARSVGEASDAQREIVARDLFRTAVHGWRTKRKRGTGERSSGGRLCPLPARH